MRSECHCHVIATISRALLLGAGAVELRNVVERHFNVDLPATLMFDYPTAQAMAKFIAERLTCTQTADVIALEVEGLSVSGDLVDAASQPLGTSTEVVSLSSRHPGQSIGQTGFWSSIAESIDLQGQTPFSRWDVDVFFAPEKLLSPGALTTRFAAYCDAVDHFDAAALRLSAVEATAIDPQIR